MSLSQTTPDQTEKRFAFGKNWKAYVKGLSDHKIEKAKASLQQRLGRSDLSGMSFLDIGCGSGLFSLAAHLLGAEVRSFDYDHDSVEATEMLKDKFGQDAPFWEISHGDVLSDEFMETLDQFDIVYSWGVLHHTGNMWNAISNATTKVKKNGQFFIAIYNDEGLASNIWGLIKKLYVKSPPWLKSALVWFFVLLLEAKHALGKVVRIQNPLPDWAQREKEQLRGMSVWHDHVDWIGGYPFEVATPCRIFSFCKERGFVLDELVTVNGHGCNEFVFSLSKKKT